jgi:hypothetical protein
VVLNCQLANAVQGAAANYSVVLNSQPADNASVHVNLTHGQNVMVEPLSLIFNNAEWNISQQISVNALDDAVDEVSITPEQVVHTVLDSADPMYRLIERRNELDVMIVDNDKAGLQLSNRSIPLVEGQIERRAYAVWLWSEPTNNVTVTVVPGEYQGIVVVPEPPVLTITATDWREPHWVELTVVDDRISKHSFSIEIDHVVSSEDYLYNGQNNSAIHEHLYSNLFVYELYPDANEVQSFGAGRLFSYNGSVVDDYINVISLTDNDAAGYKFVPLALPTCYYGYQFSGRDYHSIAKAFPEGAIDVSITMVLSITGPTTKWRAIMHYGHDEPSLLYSSRNLPADIATHPGLFLRPNDNRVVLAYGGATPDLAEEPVTNVALNKMTAVSSVYSSYMSENAVDGVNRPFENSARWLSNVGDGPHWIKINLAGLFFVEELRYWTGYNGYNAGLESWTFDVSLVEDVWDVVIDKTAWTEPEVAVKFSKTLARSVRLYSRIGRPKLYEMEVYGQPADTSIALPSAELLHIAYVKRGSLFSVYINGQLDITREASALLTSAVHNGPNPLLYFGADYWNDGLGGTIRSVCLHSKELLAEEVVQVYNEEMAYPIMALTSTQDACVPDSSEEVSAAQAMPFISEYLEYHGSGNTWAIEIYNPTCVDISLNDIELLHLGAAYGRRWHWESQSRILDTGTGHVGSGEAYVVCSRKMNNARVEMNNSACDFMESEASFFPRDAIGLSYQRELVDAIGEPQPLGFVPPPWPFIRDQTTWNVSDTLFATRDHTLVRLPHVVHGNLNWAASSNSTDGGGEWLVYPFGTMSMLGHHKLTQISCPRRDIDIDGAFRSDPTHLHECDAFAGGSCCDASEDTIVAASMSAIEDVIFPSLHSRHPFYPRKENTSVGCAAEVQYLKCGVPCSPVQERFASTVAPISNLTNASGVPTAQFRICNSFCSRLHGTCGAELDGGSTNAFDNVVAQTLCKRMVGDHDVMFSNDDCFGGGLWVSEAHDRNTTHYAILLESQPVSPVTIEVVPALLDMGSVLGFQKCLSVNPQSIVFGENNWSVPVKVTVQVEPNTVDQGLFDVCSINHGANSSDPNYKLPVGNMNVEVTVSDDDVAGVTVVNTHEPNCVNKHHASCLTTMQYTMSLNELRQGRVEDIRPVSTGWLDKWNGGLNIAASVALEVLGVAMDGSNATLNALNATNATAGDEIYSYSYNYTKISCSPIDSFQNGTIGRLDDDSKTSFIEKSLLECAALCLSADNCTSFEHAVSTSECFLSQRRMGVDGVNLGGENFVYYERLFPGCVNVTAMCGTYNVFLDTQPTANVTIITHTDGQVLVEPANQTIRPSDWLLPMEFLVCVVDDYVDQGLHSSIIRHSVLSVDAYYDEIMLANMTVDITDDDYAGVTSYCGRWCCIEPAEGGIPAHFLISLDSQPLDQVNISIQTNMVERPSWWSDSGVGQGVVASPWIVFDPANWSESQSVSITALDDYAAEGIHYTHLTILVASSDSNFNLTFVPDCHLRIFDNDQSQVTVLPSNLTIDEGGSSGNLSLKLASRPVHDVIVDVMIQTDVLPILSREMRLDVSQLLFNATNWNDSQKVLVNAIEDYTMECSGTYPASFHLQVSSNDPNYGMQQTSESVYDGLTQYGIQRIDSSWQYVGTNKTTVVVKNNDISQLVLDWNGLNGTAESFPGTYFAAKLSSQPVSNVSAHLTVDQQLFASISQRFFDGDNWNISQLFAVPAVDDYVDEDYHVGTLSVQTSSNSTCFDHLLVEHTQLIEDNDCAGLAVTSQLLISEHNRNWNQTLFFEAGSPRTEAMSVADQAYVSDYLMQEAVRKDSVTHNATYTVSLTSQPLLDVTIDMHSTGLCRRCSKDDQLRIDPPVLTFTVDTWNITQIVQVLAVDDTFIESEAYFMTYPVSLTLAATSEDPKYNSTRHAQQAIARCIGQDDGSVKPAEANCTTPDGADSATVQRIAALMNATTNLSCEVVNVASAAQGGTVQALADPHGTDGVAKSIDGVPDEGSNGWIPGNGASVDNTKPAVFTFRAATYIDSATIISGVGKSDMMLNGFRLYITDDVQPNFIENEASAKWYAVPGLQFMNASLVPGGNISGHEVTCDGQHVLDLKFNIVRATGIMVEVFDSNAAANGIVFNEFIVRTGCAFGSTNGTHGALNLAAKRYQSQWYPTAIRGVGGTIFDQWSELQCEEVGGNYTPAVDFVPCHVNVDATGCAVHGGNCQYIPAMQRDFCAENSNISNLTLSPMPVLPPLASLPPSVNVSIRVRVIDDDCPRLLIRANSLTMEEGGVKLRYNISFDTEPRGHAVVGVMPRNQRDMDTVGIGNLSHIQVTSLQNYSVMNYSSWREPKQLEVVAIDDWRDEQIHYASVAYFLGNGTRDVVCTGQELMVRFPLLWEQEALDGGNSTDDIGLERTQFELTDASAEEEEEVVVEELPTLHPYNATIESCAGDYLLFSIVPSAGRFTYPTALKWQFLQPRTSGVGEFAVISESGESVRWVDGASTNVAFNATLCSSIPIQGEIFSVRFEDDHPEFAPVCLSEIGFHLATWTVEVYYSADDLVEDSVVILRGGGLEFQCNEYTNFTVPFAIVEEGEEEEEQAAVEVDLGILDLIENHLRIQILDNDVSRVIIEPTYCAVRESGMNDSYTVVLSSEPYFSVSVDVVGDGTQLTAQGCPIGGCSKIFSGDTNLVFDGEAGKNDWRIPQVVSMTAIDDAVGEPICGEVFLKHLIDSTDPKYDNLTTPGKAIVVIDDDDVGHSGHPQVDEYSDASALYSYVDLLSGTVLQASKTYETAIHALDACGGRRKRGGDVFTFEFPADSSCQNPCPLVHAIVLPINDTGDGDYTVQFSIENISHLQDATALVNVVGMSDDGDYNVQDHVHGRPPLISDPAHEKPTCIVDNVASAAQGGTAEALINQVSYHIDESIDGQMTGSSNGWSFNGGASRDSLKSAVFTLREASYIDSVTIMSGIGRPNHMLTGFRLYITDDVQPNFVENEASAKWYAVPGVRFKTSGIVAGGSIIGHEVICDGQHVLDLEFNIVRATGIMMEIFDSNAGNDNVVLTEFIVNTACARTRSTHTAHVITDIYENRTQCQEEIHTTLGISCSDAVIQGYVCYEMETVYKWYDFDCQCTCKGLSLGGSPLTITAITYLPFEPYPPAAVAVDLQERNFSRYPYIRGQHTNLDLSIAGNISSFVVTIFDAYNHKLNSSTWLYPHPGRGNVRASRSNTLIPTVHILPRNSSESTCYVDGYISSWCTDLVEEPSAVSQVVELEDGSFLAFYNVTRSDDYDLKVLIDDLHIGRNNCSTTFGGLPRTCTISKGERGMDSVARGESPDERARVVECFADECTFLGRRDSPYGLKILAAESFPPSATFSGPGVDGGVVHSIYATFTVQARDRFSNARVQGGDLINTEAIPNTTEHNKVYVSPGQWSHAYLKWDVESATLDLRNGQYVVSWLIASYPSTEWPVPSVEYQVIVQVNLELVATWLVNFDVGLHFEPNASTAIGPGAGSVGIDAAALYTASLSTKTLQHSRRPGGPRLLAGEMAMINIQARSLEGWSIRVGGPELHLSVEPTDSVLAWRAIDRGDGSFDVAYLPSRTGPHNVTVSLGWPRFALEPTPIADQPAHVFVFPGPAYHRTSVLREEVGASVSGERMHLTLQSRDVFSNDAMVSV